MTVSVSRREQVLAALHARLAAGLAAEVLRNEVLPQRVPDCGVAILYDGSPGQPAVTLSPLTYHYEHRAEIEVVMQPSHDRETRFDALLAGIGTALAADRTLGGLCDWVEPEAPAPVDLPVDGAPSLRAASVAVRLHYTTTDPLA